MLHHCDATVIGEASPCLHTHHAAPGQANPNEIVQPQIPTVLLEPRVVEAIAFGPLIGANYRMLASLLATRQVKPLQGLLKTLLIKSVLNNICRSSIINPYSQPI